jgi:hypothetical protein
MPHAASNLRIDKIKILLARSMVHTDTVVNLVF